MSEKIKIKLTVADRVYPLTISPNQEASLRISAKKIDEMTKQLEQNYEVRDKQDFLSMYALKYSAQL
jgi:cell division protein ZapA